MHHDVILARQEAAPIACSIFGRDRADGQGQ
jgi:hypothetical protein